MGMYDSIWTWIITRIDGALDGELYCDILKNDLVKKLKHYIIPLHNMIFQHDNDSKYRPKKLKSA